MIQNCIGKLLLILSGVVIWEGGGTKEEEEVMVMPSTLAANGDFTTRPHPVHQNFMIFLGMGVSLAFFWCLYV
jgi:hypothetical protein